LDILGGITAPFRNFSPRLLLFNLNFGGGRNSFEERVNPPTVETGHVSHFEHTMTGR